MKFDVTKTEVWAAPIEDRPGGLNEKLAALSEAGVNLGFVVSRRAPEQAGKGVVFVTPLKGAKQNNAAVAAGFQKTDSLHSVRIEGVDKPGVCNHITRALADADINLRGLSGAALGRRFVLYLALDSGEDAAKAASILKKLA